MKSHKQEGKKKEINFQIIFKEKGAQERVENVERYSDNTVYYAVTAYRYIIHLHSVEIHRGMMCVNAPAKVVLTGGRGNENILQKKILPKCTQYSF